MSDHEYPSHYNLSVKWVSVKWVSVKWMSVKCPQPEQNVALDP